MQVKIAAFQAPLLPTGSFDALELIQERVAWCETEAVSVLCCPEAILGGFADNAPRPADIALDIQSGQLADTLRPLASQTVTTIVGFTERGEGGDLYNAAAILHQGSLLGIYRKLHPAIRRSVYTAGEAMPVFEVEGLTFGILICNDSNFPDAARGLVAKGATTLFIPTNTALPLDRADVRDAARQADVTLAQSLGVAIVRADITGRTTTLQSPGSSAIVGPGGALLGGAPPFEVGILLSELAETGVTAVRWVPSECGLTNA